MKNIKSKTLKGFTLIELLVVVAIIGILASVGVYSYVGYIEGTKTKTAKNVMQQIALKQTERYTDLGSYYSGSDINTNLFDGGNVANVSGYTFSVTATVSGYSIVAAKDDGSCITLNDLMIEGTTCP